MFTQHTIPVEVDPILAGNGAARVELLGKTALGPLDPLTIDARTLGPLDPLAVESLRALRPLHLPALHPLLALRPLKALPLNPRRTLGALLPLDPRRTFGSLNALALDPLRTFGALEARPFDPLLALGPLNALALDLLGSLGALEARPFDPLRALGPLRALDALLALRFALLAALARLGTAVAISIAAVAGRWSGQSQGRNAGNQKILASHIILLAKIKSLECQRIGLEDEPVPHMNLPVSGLAWSWREGG